MLVREDSVRSRPERAGEGLRNTAMRNTIKLSFTTGFKTGNRALDIQVRILMGLFQDLMDAYGAERDPQEVTDLEGSATAYFTRYITEQEKEMTATGYPSLSHHRLHHQRYALEFKTIMQEADIAQRLILYAGFLEDFLALHVMTLDKDFSRFCQARTG